MQNSIEIRQNFNSFTFKNVDINVYESTINQINQKLLASEEITAYDIMSGIFNYFLCNIPTLFWKSKYLKAFDEIIDLITIQNRSYFNAKGVHMNDPIMSGLRHVILISKFDFKYSYLCRVPKRPG